MSDFVLVFGGLALFLALVASLGMAATEKRARGGEGAER